MSRTDRHRVGLPPLRCSARSKRTGERCRSWAVRGTTVCYYHGGKTPTVADNATVTLTRSVLERTAPGDPQSVMLTAMTICHLAQLDALHATRRNGLGADWTAALEAARHSMLMVLAAIKAGEPYAVTSSGGELVTVDAALATVVPAVMSVVTDVMTAATSPLQHSEDVLWQREVVAWAGPAMAARVQGEPGEPVPQRVTVIDPVVESPGWAERPPPVDVQDAELVSDDDDGAYTAAEAYTPVPESEPVVPAAAVSSSPPLVHTDFESFEADGRPGAVLVADDGRVLMERIAPPSRSLAGRSVWR